MQVEIFDLMNVLFKEETEQKQNMKTHLVEKFQKVSPTKTAARVVTQKKKYQDIRMDKARAIMNLNMKIKQLKKN